MTGAPVNVHSPAAPHPSEGDPLGRDLRREIAVLHDVLGLRLSIDRLLSGRFDDTTRH